MTPEDFKVIAGESYRVDGKIKDKVPIYPNDIIEVNGQEWQVLKTKDNKWTGFQAMAVAPVSDGTNPSNVVIAYAGTNPFQFGDPYSDVANVVLSNGGGQMWEAKRFADQVAGEYYDEIHNKKTKVVPSLEIIYNNGKHEVIQ